VRTKVSETQMNFRRVGTRTNLVKIRVVIWSQSIIIL